jgi:hypothetical protein
VLHFVLRLTSMCFNVLKNSIILNSAENLPSFCDDDNIFILLGWIYVEKNRAWKNTQGLLKKPAGYFTGCSGITGFLKQAFQLKMSIFGRQDQSHCNF